jgi:tetratricopeptide (TPR) repeat protein
MSNVAWIYLQKGDVDKALPLLEEAFAVLRAKFPPLHSERLMTSQTLARAYHAAEQFDKSVPLQETLTSQYKAAYGDEDRSTRSCTDTLIGFYVDVGSCDKADSLLKTIKVGDDNLAPAEKQQQEQRVKRHRQLIDRVRPAAEKYLRVLATNKAEHPDALAARLAFAVALRTQGRRSAAAYHLKAVLDARQRLLPADSADIQECRVQLGATRVQQKKYAEAEPLLLEAYAALRRHENQQPKTQNSLTKALDQIVKLYERWGKKDKAEEWRKKLEEQAKD